MRSRNTFISPNQYGTPDIACHLGATPAGVAAPVNAGDVLEIQWNKWPASHKGPVIDYLANCGGPCETADKTKLKFFKISEAGLLDAAANNWAADQLLANNLSWSVRLPADISPGNYVLRHEMIALHAAGNANGAQNYPFCFNLAVAGNGTATPDGVPATALYKAQDPGILFDLFRKFTTYVIPGPALYSGALTATQTKPGAIKATAAGVSSYVAPTATAPAAPVAKTVAGAAPAAPAASSVTTASAGIQKPTPARPVHTTMVTAVLKVKKREG